MIQYEFKVKLTFQCTIFLVGEPGNLKYLVPCMQIVLRKTNNYLIIT